jgi:methionine-rich copper-binding protein CopC
MNVKTLALACAIVIGGIASAHAHDEEKGPNGGQVVDASGHHLEFVASGSDLTVFLTDEKAAAISSAGAKMKAIVQQNGKTDQVALSAAEPNKLVGKAAAPLGTGAKVVVTGSMADGHAIQGRFVIQ